ncbi:DegV family protein [Acholeplasma sp. OttesenSCG-928-E16]|nr:DegV family protein [Acholeplasma sp. OttesenSCG-928-E16]
MGKRKILATSTSCLDYYKDIPLIDIIRIKVIINDKIYEDGLDLKADYFYKLLIENKDLLPTTSQPPVGELLELFDKLEKEGYEELFILTISSHLSGSFNAISLAANEHEGKMKITVFDTKTVYSGEAEMALLAHQLFVVEQKPAKEVIDVLSKYLYKTTIAFICEDLNNLIKNGRLTGAKAFFGKMMKIKPLLVVNHEGKIVTEDKQRTSQKALDSLISYCKNFINGRKFRVIYLYTNESLNKKVQEAFKKAFSCDDNFSIIGSPVVGAHIGPYVAGLSLFIEE